MAKRVGISSQVDVSIKCIVRILEVDEHREREKLERKAEQNNARAVKHFTKKKKHACVCVCVLNRL